jgi:hypothetical protein
MYHFAAYFSYGKVNNNPTDISGLNLVLYIYFETKDLSILIVFRKGEPYNPCMFGEGRERAF